MGMELANIEEIKSTIPSHVQIVAATKYVTEEDMLKLLPYGINCFGENRVDALIRKWEKLKSYPIHWHFIGHLQRNKAVEIIDKIECLHSLDSIELARIIEKHRIDPLDCYVEVNINHEESKHGVEVQKLNSFFEQVLQFKKIRVIGLMAMSKAESSSKEKYQQFKALAYLRDRINQTFDLNLQGLSMGMSEDYQEAISAGATVIRLGRILWKQEK